MLVLQDKGYALGNFIMTTPTIKYLSEGYGKIDVLFTKDYVKECFLDCPFINIVEESKEVPIFSSALKNLNIPDYKFIFKKVTKRNWTPKYHTYVDKPSEYSFPEKYLLLLNGLGGLSKNPSDPLPHWYGKKELDESIFRRIKDETNLPIYFTGSETDLMQTPWVIDIADKIEIGNIRKSLAMVRDAEKIIANDTGLAHAAAAMRKSILILWKDTPYVKNTNPNHNTIYSQKGSWEKSVNNYLKV